VARAESPRAQPPSLPRRRPQYRPSDRVVLNARTAPEASPRGSDGADCGRVAAPSPGVRRGLLGILTLFNKSDSAIAAGASSDLRSLSTQGGSSSPSALRPSRTSPDPVAAAARSPGGEATQPATEEPLAPVDLSIELIELITGCVTVHAGTVGEHGDVNACFLLEDQPNGTVCSEAGYTQLHQCRR